MGLEDTGLLKISVEEALGTNLIVLRRLRCSALEAMSVSPLLP